MPQRAIVVNVFRVPKAERFAIESKNSVPQAERSELPRPEGGGIPDGAAD